MMKRGAGAYPEDMGRLSNNRPRIQQFEYIPDRSSREKKERWKEERRRCVPQVLRGKRRRAKIRPKKGSRVIRTLFFPLRRFRATSIAVFSRSALAYNRAPRSSSYCAWSIGCHPPYIQPTRGYPSSASLVIIHHRSYPNKGEEEGEGELRAQTVGHWWAIFCNGSFQGFFSLLLFFSFFFSIL